METADVIWKTGKLSIRFSFRFFSFSHRSNIAPFLFISVGRNFDYFYLGHEYTSIFHLPEAFIRNSYTKFTFPSKYKLLSNMAFIYRKLNRRCTKAYNFAYTTSVRVQSSVYTYISAAAIFHFEQIKTLIAFWPVTWH